VLHVNPAFLVNEPPAGVDLGEITEREGREILEPATANLAASDVLYDLDTRSGDPACVICRVANEEGYDLIVMGSRGIGLISEMLLGSVSHSVIQHANCPVLIVK
jgi:nucleotide-binding universal stress UspA family protein